MRVPEDLPAVIRRHMQARGMSQRATAAAAPCDSGLLSRILSGERECTEQLAVALDRALAANGEIRTAAAHPVPARTAAQAERVRTALDGVIGDGTMSDAALADWDETVARHGRATRDVPPALLIADLACDLAELHIAIQRHRSASALRHLMLIAAQMSGMMCLTLIKSGDRQAFRRWARTARQAAAESGDLATTSWVLAQEAYGYYYAGEYLLAADVAASARASSPAAGCVGTALAAALQMRALAALGDAEGTAEAMRAAEHMLASLTDTERTSSAFGYSSAQLAFHTGNALTHLGDTATAYQVQDRALTLIPKRDYTDRSMTRLDRAACLLAEGDVSSGLSEASDTIAELTPPQRAGIITGRGHQILSAAPAQAAQTPAARNLRDLLTTDGEELPP